MACHRTALVFYPASKVWMCASCGHVLFVARRFRLLAGPAPRAHANPVHRLFLDWPRWGAVAKQRLVERLAGIVGERGAACGSDRGGTCCRRVEMRRPREVLDDMQQVLLAAFVGRTVALDEPAALGQFAAQCRVFASALFDGREPALDHGLLGGVAAAAPPQSLQRSEGAQCQQAADRIALPPDWA